ncbi:MAG: WYL domain-containing protein [Phenylobacterium sp.]|uniref:helix-turn-helix transcriptional regulator n=1 Tax=Phenylobacterium sp. TaxID=1871053 RepID=UPI002736FAC2|nr:WYL domain-containing protein [Phenylobacterium sp.]MDP3746350.1 WYL domain-containing protein [Phenylobacterium sp.]
MFVAVMVDSRSARQPKPPAHQPPGSQSISAARRRRFAFLEAELFWKGEVGREVLSTTFDLTPNHVTDDLATYKATCPSNLVYDERRRRYRPGPRFRPRFIAANPQRYLAELRARAESLGPAAGGMASVEVVPDPAGAVDVDLLQAATRAIHSRTALKITYQSLTTADPTRRLIFPHALAHNGRRWFMRAYDTLRGDFRDFALARVLTVTRDQTPAPEETDLDWDQRLPVRVRPNPRLHPFQCDIVAREYGMRRDGEGWLWEVQIRRAMVVYFLDLHSLRSQAREESPDRKPLVLENYQDIQMADWSLGRRSNGSSVD